MSSDQPTNPTDDLGKVLAQYLQQQAPGKRNGGAADNGHIPCVPNSTLQMLHHQWTHQGDSSTVTSEQETGSLSKLLATYVQQAALNPGLGDFTAATITNATSSAAQTQAHLHGDGGVGRGYFGLNPPHSVAPSFPSNLSQMQPPPPTSDTSTEIGQQIIASAQLLAAINPNLAAAAITHAFSLSSQRNEHQHWQQQQQANTGTKVWQMHLESHQNQPQQAECPLQLLSNQHRQAPFGNDTNGLSTKNSYVPTLPFLSSAPLPREDHIDVMRDSLPSDTPNSNVEIAPKQDVRYLNNDESTPGAAKSPALRAGVTTAEISSTTNDANRLKQVKAAAAAAAASKPALTSLTENVSAKNWTLEQLESHAKQLQDWHQPIPQSIAILLASARRREEKHNAKKMANRKSALSSRARKKAQIDAMAQENLRLKREAMILSFIPDPVVAIAIDGEITFCSAQMERVLQHKAEDLIRANIEWFIFHESRNEFRRMIEDVITAEEHAITRENMTGDDGGPDIERNHGNNSSDSDPNVISLRSSEQSFSMPQVKNDSSEDISNSSGDRNEKPTVESKHVPSFCTEARTRDYGAHPRKKSKVHADDIMGFPVTANNANGMLSSLQYAKSSNKQTESNMKSPHEMSQLDQELHACLHQKKASAPRTSSLLTEKREYHSSSSDSSSNRTKGPFLNSSDSGYRESSDSPKESNESSSSTMSNSDEDGIGPPKDVQRTLPLAPACNICLIRKDLNTLWCEVTASIYTRAVTDGNFEAFTSSQRPETSSKAQSAMHKSESNMPQKETKELLLCFRPITQGDKVGHGP